ncbi:hypothetical protein RB195_019805 [Necator americanus]|uniref:Uncharacterized protein n=1 Tax=Necator americanus TaxID=51031 RepID=A0ABR1CFU6_NECAM
MLIKWLIKCTRHAKRKGTPNFASEEETVPVKTSNPHPINMPTTYEPNLLICATFGTSNKDNRVRRHQTVREETTPPFPSPYMKLGKNCSLEHATVEELVGMVSSSTQEEMNIESKARIGHLRMRGCGSTSALTVYSPTSSYEEENVEAFYVDL